MESNHENLMKRKYLGDDGGHSLATLTPRRSTPYITTLKKSDSRLHLQVHHHLHLHGGILDKFNDIIRSDIMCQKWVKFSDFYPRSEEEKNEKNKNKKIIKNLIKLSS